MVEQEIHHPALGPLNRRAPAACGTVRAVSFVPRSSATQTACV